MKISCPVLSFVRCIPANASEILPLVVCNSLGTEIPNPSSQTDITIGICKTPAALIVSQNGPSEVEASPIVPNATSFPLFVNFLNFSKSFNVG